MDKLHEKFEQLKAILRGMESAAIAYSSGVDSTFLLRAAHEVLGERCCAVTAKSGAIPEREMEEAVAFCRENGITHFVVEIDEMSVKGFAENPPDRCYHCKKEIFTAMGTKANAEGYSVIAEGSNTDDMGDYRPGMRAIVELGIASPLRAAGLSKADIRALSKEMGLPTWDKPSFACLASRFVYGERITKEKLKMVELAEQYLLDAGFSQFRVRMHGETLARIEVLPEEFTKLCEIKREIQEHFKKLGFLYVTVDLAGYQMGSMNAALKLDK